MVVHVHQLFSHFANVVPPPWFQAWFANVGLWHNDEAVLGLWLVFRQPVRRHCRACNQR